MASRPTSIQLITGLITLALTVPPADAQQLPARTAVTDAEALRLARTEKLDLILPGAMRDNDVDMWIHVSRYGGIFANGHGDPMDQHFGRTSGYLIFTDLGDRIERAVFGSPGAVERIDVRGSDAVALALGGWNYNNTDPRIGYSVPAVYREITDFVAQRDPQTIAVNTSDWLPLADGISHSAYERLVQILGPKYSERIVSAENVIMDFVVRRTAREIAAQVEVLALARQSAKQRLSQVVPGVTTVGEIGARVYYSATNTPDKTVPNDPPDARWFFNDPDYADYVLQRGDLFAYIMYTAGNAAVMDADGFVPGGGSGGDYMGFGADAKIHAYILREGETEVPDFIQRVFDKTIARRLIMRDHMKVGMTAKESLDAMVAAMKAAGYVYTPFVDVGTRDYEIIQNALANTDKPGFSIDNHATGNSGEVGPSMAAFRADTHHMRIQENHLFSFSYMVHMNIAERPGYPLAFNVANPQVITSRGVELIQPPNEEIFLIH